MGIVCGLGFEQEGEIEHGFIEKINDLDGLARGAARCLRLDVG